MAETISTARASTTSAAPPPTELDAELAGLDALDTAPGPTVEWPARFWSALWPKLVAVAIFLTIWQLLVSFEVKPSYVLPGPLAVLSELQRLASEGLIGKMMSTTLTRAAVGFALAAAIGVVIGALVSRISVLRVGVGSMLTSLQTMPSIAWFPFSIMLFQLSESAILFVVVLGAAPAIANGLMSGTDQVPPLLLRAGTVLGARRWSLFWNVVLPASLPTFVGGRKQGWAFAWRSLLAGEIIVIIPSRPSLGAQLAVSRDLADAPALVATMVLIFVIGVFVDAGFGVAERGLLRRRDLLLH